MANNTNTPSNSSFYALLVSLVIVMAFGLIGTITLSDSSKAEARNQLLALLGAGSAGLLALLNSPQHYSSTETRQRLSDIERKLSSVSDDGLSVQVSQKVPPTASSQSSTVAVAVQPSLSVGNGDGETPPVDSTALGATLETRQSNNGVSVGAVKTLYAPTVEKGLPIRIVTPANPGVRAVTSSEAPNTEASPVPPSSPSGYRGEY